MRGAVLPRLPAPPSQGHLGLRAALAVQTVIFASLHGPAWPSPGHRPHERALVLATGSLWPAIVIHFCNNVVVCWSRAEALLKARAPRPGSGKDPSAVVRELQRPLVFLAFRKVITCCRFVLRLAAEPAPAGLHRGLPLSFRA